MGRLYRITGETGKAVAELQKAIALDPMNVSAYTNLATAFIDSFKISPAFTGVVPKKDKEKEKDK